MPTPVSYTPHPTQLGGYVCSGCGGDVVDLEVHTRFHTRLDKALRIIATLG